jgi:DNA-binding Xre family transcriptional regulator
MNSAIGGVDMIISYAKLWKMLIDKKMKKVELMRQAKISSNALAHLSKDEAVSVEIIGKICATLKCTPNDILEFTENNIEENVDI